MEEEMLTTLHNGEITAMEAYESLYRSKPPVPFEKKHLKRAHFIKMRIHLPKESRRLNLFLKTLFAFPLPISIANLFLRLSMRNDKRRRKFQKHFEDTAIDTEHLPKMLRYARHTRIDIESDDARIRISIK